MREALSRSWILFLFFLLFVPSLYAKKQPQWIFNPPGGDTYYLGVGAATGKNKAEGYQVALERAKSNLAADISVHIVSTSSDLFRSTKSNSSYGDESESQDQVVEQYEQNMSQFVEKNLKDIEVVDSWYSKKEGTWVFVRLSKAAYERMKQKEMGELRGRVLDQISPIIDGEVDIQDAISRYFNAWNMVHDSFYLDEIKGNVNGREGFLIDRIESAISDFFNDVQFDLTVLSAVEVNKPLPITLSIFLEGIKDGRVPLLFVQGRDNRVLASITTDSDGNYSEPIKLEGLKGVGKVRVRCILDLSQFSNQLDSFYKDILAPGEDLSLTVKLVKLGFEVETGDATVSGINGSIKSLLKKKSLPIELVPGVTGDRDLFVEVIFSLMPKVFQNQPQMVKSKAIFTLKEGGNTVFSYETKEIKNGGATEDQAYYNCWSALQKLIEKDEIIAEKILGAL